MLLAFIKRKRAFNGLNFMNFILLGWDNMAISYFHSAVCRNEICKSFRKWEIVICFVAAF